MNRFFELQLRTLLERGNGWMGGGWWSPVGFGIFVSRICKGMCHNVVMFMEFVIFEIHPEILFSTDLQH